MINNWLDGDSIQNMRKHVSETNRQWFFAFIFCCSVATDLRVLYFSPTDDLQDLVCYDIKLVLII